MYGNEQFYGGRGAPQYGGGNVQYSAQRVQYGAPAVQSVQYGQEVALPQQQYSPTVFNAHAFKVYGAVLALLAAAALSLGIADVMLTKEAYCNPWSTSSPYWCSTSDEPYIWTWVASGIWASIPIFFAGIFSMCLSASPGQWTRVFALLIFLSAIVFAPGMCVLSAIEVWRGSASKYTFYNLDNGVKAGTIMPSDNPYVAKFVIPLVIAILAAIMFLMTAVVTLFLCCCMHSLGIYLPSEIDEFSVAQAPAVVQQAPQVVQQREVYYPTRPQIRNYYDVNVYPQGNSDQYGQAQTQIPTRYNPGGANNLYGNFGGSNNLYGNFASRAQPRGGMGPSFASDFFKPNPAYFWQ